MIINNEDIIDGLESYRNKHGLSNAKMAKLLEMSQANTYTRVKKEKNMTIKFLVNFFNNANVDPLQFFKTLIKINEYPDDTITPSDREAAPPDKKICKNPECLHRIDDLIEAISNQNRHISKLYEEIDRLKSGEGDSPHEKVPEGGVEKTKRTG